MEQHTVAETPAHRYDKNLVFAKKAGVKRGLMTGVGVGVMWLFVYLAYALAFWYGMGLILDARQGDGNYDPSKLIIVSLVFAPSPGYFLLVTDGTVRL